MKRDIEAIFIDVGNTMRILIKDEPHQARARQEIVRLVGTQESPDLFCEQLNLHYKTYRKWAFEHMIEAPEKELWNRWMLPEFPPEKIASIAGELTYQYRQSMGRRVLIQDVEIVLAEMTWRGYILGIISNVITTNEIPDWLEADGLAKYFKAVVLSSRFGRRKPDPEIYWEAARVAGVDPAKSAYVGDNPSRDVVGTRCAGFGMAIIMTDPSEVAQQPPLEDKPDLIIHEFRELLDIFPGCPHTMT